TYSIAHETQVPLARQMKDCPLALDRFFDRALSKDPAKRFPDARSFRDGLIEAAQAKPPDPSEGTVVEPVQGPAAAAPAPTTPLGRTVPLPPGASLPGEKARAAALRSGEVARVAAPRPGESARADAPPPLPGPRRGRILPWAVGSVALAGACAAAWLLFARADSLRAMSHSIPPQPPPAADQASGTPLPRREDILLEVK